MTTDDSAAPSSGAGTYDDFDLGAAYAERGAITLEPLTADEIEAFWAAEAEAEDAEFWAGIAAENDPEPAPDPDPAEAVEPEPPGEGFARLLAALRVEPHERVMVFRLLPGQEGMPPSRGSAGDAPARALLTNPDAPPANTWFSVCPLDPEKEAALSLGQRNSEATAARVPVLWADLDVKPGGLASFDQCREVIAKVSESLGNRQPVAIVSTGHGLQPFWGVDGGDDVPRAAALLRRFGLLVKAAAGEMGGSADSVFDLARILRVPGTWNVKDPENPLPVTVEFTEDEGYEPESIDLDELALRLDELGITDKPMPTGSAAGAAGGEEAPLASWPFAAETCSYARTMVQGWASDSPKARHPWLGSQAVRLLTLLRAGCITPEDFKAAGKALSARFATLCDRKGDPRPVKPFEVSSWFVWAQAKVESTPLAVLWADVAHAAHAAYGGTDAPGEAGETADADADADGLWERSAELATIRQFALARMVAPEAVLFVVLARVGQTIPPHVCTPPLVGGRGSLNSLLALVTRPGGGKGGASAAAAECVVLPVPVHTSNIGSGEGMAKQFVRWEPKAKEHVRVRSAALFDAAEVKGLKALMDRNGATLEDQLLKMYSGESLGYGYADDAKAGQVAGHSYRGALVVGVQVSNAAILLGMAESGMPQRFEWARAEDAAITRQRPPAPDPVVLPALDWSLEPGVPVAWREFPLCAEAVEETLLAREQNMRGEVGALDGHAMFTRIKLACRVAVLHGRQEVTPWDWETSGLLMARSERTREWAAGQLQRAKNEGRNRSRAERARDAVVMDEALAEAKVRGATTAIRRKLGRGSATRRALKDACGSQYRPGFVAALDALLEDGSVVRNGQNFSLREES